MVYSGDCNVFLLPLSLHQGHRDKHRRTVVTTHALAPISAPLSHRKPNPNCNANEQNLAADNGHRGAIEEGSVCGSVRTDPASTSSRIYARISGEMPCDGRTPSGESSGVAQKPSLRKGSAGRGARARRQRSLLGLRQAYVGTAGGLGPWKVGYHRFVSGYGSLQSLAGSVMGVGRIDTIFTITRCGDAAPAVATFF